MADDYRWDVFVSVKEGYPFTEWLEEFFLPLFHGYLDQEIAQRFKRKSEVYYYKREIEPGHYWPDELDQALSSARVVLALCSPLYFQAPWCLREFETFHQRAKDTGANVLIPVSIYDGETFPEELVATLQFEQLSDYVLTGRAFRETETYIQMQKAVKRLCKVVADRAAKAPQFGGWSNADEPQPAPPPPILQVGL